MTKRRTIGLFGLLALLGVGLIAGGVANRSPMPGPIEPTYTVTGQLTTQQLNDRMLESTTFRLNPGDSLKQRIETIRRTFRPNRYAQAVLHGNAAHVPVGWAYVELVNATNQIQPLVLSMPQYRCQQATLFLGRATNGRVGPGMVGPFVAGRFNPVGTLQNTTPIGQRFFPFISFAFPFTLQPRERLPLLLRPQSVVGFHEVAVQLSRRSVYAEAALTDSIRDGL